MEIDVDESNRKRIWMADAESSISRNCIETARAIYSNSCEILNNKKSIWIAYADFETIHGSFDQLNSVLEQVIYIIVV